MFGFAADVLFAEQRTQELAVTSATACYKKADQHVSQVQPPCAVCAPRSECPVRGSGDREVAPQRSGTTVHGLACGPGVPHDLACGPGVPSAFSLVACGRAGVASLTRMRSLQCHGAMKAMGITIGKNGQLVISDKKAFTTSDEPSHV